MTKIFFCILSVGVTTPVTPPPSVPSTCGSVVYSTVTHIGCVAKDSLRYLVQDSLSNFTQMVVDGCHSTMQCEESMVWGDDVINSPYKSVVGRSQS